MLIRRAGTYNYNKTKHLGIFAYNTIANTYGCIRKTILRIYGLSSILRTKLQWQDVAVLSNASSATLIINY